MANAEYYGVTGDKEYLSRALKAYNIYWELWYGAEDPVGLPPKTEIKTRAGRNFGIPMICLNITNILMRVDSENIEFYKGRAIECIEDIFTNHVHPELECVLENVGPNGEARVSFTEGRIVNPRHDIEAVWFILEYAKTTKDINLVKRAETIFHWATNSGWDEEYGGLLYFVDALG